MSKRYKKVCGILNYIQYFLILDSAVTECIFISILASLVGILLGVTSSTIGFV